VVSNLSKFLMVIWVFAVLILTSSYTSSLTSMLTVQKLRPAVTDVNDLLDNGDYVGYQEGSFVYGELLKMNFDPSKLRSYSTPAEYADALSRGSDDGGVAAVFDEVPYLKVFLSQPQYCDGYVMSGPVYKGTDLGFAFPRGSPMATEVSRAIVGLTEGDNIDLIERKWFGVPGSCGDGVDAANASLTLWNFSGLFLVTAVAATLVLLVYLVMFIYRERHEVRAAAEPGSGSVSLKRFRAWLQHYDRKDMTAPHFRQQQGWSDSPSTNGGSSQGRKRAEQDEATATRDFGGPRASPLSDHSRMDSVSASPLERKGSNEFRTPFEQRMGEAAAASAERRSSTPERKPSLKLPQDTEERKKLPLSP
jgi:ionotropic glutamate receptor